MRTVSPTLQGDSQIYLWKHRFGFVVTFFCTMAFYFKNISKVNHYSSSEAVKQMRVEIAHRGECGEGSQTGGEPLAWLSGMREANWSPRSATSKSGQAWPDRGGQGHQGGSGLTTETQSCQLSWLLGACDHFLRGGEERRYVCFSGPLFSC